MPFMAPYRRSTVVADAFRMLEAAERAAKKKTGPAPEPVALARPKENVATSGPYMAAVRTLACRRCSHQPPEGKPRNQFCHRDQGKGKSLKTDVRQGWAGCGPHDGVPGCHWEVGTSGRIPKEERRRLEDEYAASTRAEVQARGLWPKKLPLWPEAPTQKPSRKAKK